SDKPGLYEKNDHMAHLLNLARFLHFGSGLYRRANRPHSRRLQHLRKKEAHGEIETFHPGFLLGQDTYYVGYIKGVGKIYQQTGIDTFSNVGFAKLYTDKTAITAADF